MFIDYGMFSTIKNSTFDFNELAQKDTVVTIVVSAKSKMI